MTKYRKWGFTGPLLPVRYYVGDAPCAPNSKYPGMLSPSIGSDTRDTPIQEISRQLAWFIYNNFSHQGTAVNVVAHSMGGLIIRHAIYAVQTHRAGYPPFLVVPQVTTFGTPHNGVQLFWIGCRFQQDAKQCHQMGHNSDFIKNLQANAQNPQAAYGTFWSVAGSLDETDSTIDTGVSARSAVSMSVPYKIYWGTDAGIEHNDYMHKLLTDNLPFEISAHCWGTSNGADYDHMGPEGFCWWPLQWSFAIMYGIY